MNHDHKTCHLRKRGTTMNAMTTTQEELDARLWWTTVRPWLGHMTSWPKPRRTMQEQEEYRDSDLQLTPSSPTTGAT